MSNLADTLTTSFVLKDDYTAGVNKASQATSNFAKHAKAAQASVGGGSGGGLAGAFSSLKGGITPVTAAFAAIVAGITAVVGAGAGIIATAKESLDAFAPYDTLERTFAGIYGSAAKAKQEMRFLNSEAQKSNFLYTDLAKNAKLLVLQGMKWSNYSNAIQGLAIRGGGTSEALGMATSTVTRIKGGDFGEAFENLRQFGYSRDVLTQMGLVFDKSGSYKGNVQQALAVIQKIGLENKAIVDAMNGGAEATIGNLTESFHLALADAGSEVYKALKPAMEGLSSAISDAINSGAIKDTVSFILDLFDGDGGPTNFEKVVASVLAGVRTAASWVKMLWETIVSILNSPIVKGILKFLGMGKLGGFGGVAFNADLSKIYDNNYAQILGQLNRAKDKREQGGDVAEPDNPSAQPLSQIAANTAETAKHVKEQKENWARNVFGGGDLGRMGVTAMELHRNRANDNVRVDVLNAKSIEDIIRKAVYAGVAHGKRVGAH